MSLAALGLTAIEEQIYRLLLSSPGRDPSTLGLDPVQTTAAVDRLVALGLVAVDDGGALTAKPPNTSLELLAQRRIARILADLAAVARARDAFPDMTAGADQMEVAPPPPAERLHGRDLVIDRISEEWHVEPASEVRAARSGPRDASYLYRRRLYVNALFNLRQGVAYRTLVHTSTLDNPAYVAYARELHHVGDLHRVTSDPIQEMLIYDRTRAYLPLIADNPQAGALRIQDPGTIATLVELFDSAWQRATDLELALVPDATAYDKRVLHALLENTTDQAAARQLNISVRTFRRHVADLMTRLHAGNRFQLAANAKEKGWL